MKWSLPVFCALIFLSTSQVGFSQARKAIKSLKDVEVLTVSEGNWEGVGIGFDLLDGKLQAPQSFRDNWNSSFKGDGKTYEMTGLVKRGAVDLPYTWIFKFNGDRDKITAAYEMPDRTGTLGVKILADGQRVQLFPIEGQKGIDMTIDIYFEDKDIVIESRVRDLKGDLVYQSATRYQRVDSGN